MKWQEIVHHGKWVSGVNAGGSGLTNLTTHKGNRSFIVGIQISSTLHVLYDKVDASRLFYSIVATKKIHKEL